MDGTPQVLTLVWRTRPAVSGATERRFLDLVVDGRSLLDVVGGDVCSPLGWGRPEVEAATRRRLRLDAPRLLPDDREPLFVCPECADLGCGAVTARLTASAGLVTWSDLAFESPGHVEPVPDVGPFHFEWMAYRSVLG